MTSSTEVQAGQPGEKPNVARGRWRVELRPHVSPAMKFGAVLVALLGSFLVSSVLVAIGGANILTAFAALLQGAAGGWKPIAETLVQSTPLIFTGLAVTVAFRAGIWNIGGEGQFVMGAVGGVAVVLLGAKVLPQAVLIPLYLVVAMVCGALTGMLAGYLKTRFNVSEVIVTVMLNFILQYFLAFLLSGVWRDPDTQYIQSMTMPDIAYLPRLIAKTRLNVGFLLGLATAAVTYLLLWKNTLGYEIRALGINPVASKYKGINVTKVTLLVMGLSGAIAGLGGASYVPGLQQHLRLDVSSGYGYAGILIAMLGRLNPLGVVIAGLFFGSMVTGASAMQVATGVPVAIAQAIQGITLVFLVVADVLAQYCLVRVADRG